MSFCGFYKCFQLPFFVIRVFSAKSRKSLIYQNLLGSQDLVCLNMKISLWQIHYRLPTDQEKKSRYVLRNELFRKVFNRFLQTDTITKI